MNNKAAKLGAIMSSVLVGFESPLPHDKTRAQRGFCIENNLPGQNPGQKAKASVINSIPPYKLAKVYNGPKEWFVYYHYWSLSKQKYEREKVRLEQRGLSIDDRQAMLEDLRDEVNKELLQRNKRKKYHNEGKKKTRKAINRSIVEWLDVAQLDEKLLPSWKVTFSQLKSKLLQFYEQHPALYGADVFDIDDEFLETYVWFMQDDGLATKTINKHLWGIEALTGWLKKNRQITSRVETKEYRVDEIKNETERYPPLTHKEKEAAFDYFGKTNEGYQLMIYWQYYTCIRPKEIHRIPIKHINLEKKWVYLPHLSTKNGLSAYVQLFDPLVEELKRRQIEKLPGDWFLFGDKCQPSADMYQGQYCSNTWTKHRTKMKMPKEKQAYGLKHTFNVDYVENNKYSIDWEFLRRHNRHATIQQTQEYISTLTAYFLDETKAVILDYTSKKNTKAAKVKKGK